MVAAILAVLFVFTTATTAHPAALYQTPTPVPGGPFDDTGGDQDRDQERDREVYCVGAEPHPGAQRLSDEYEVPYEQIMEWFCSGYGIGEIENALWAAEQTGLTPEEILELHDELGGWGKVWQELGLNGPDGDEDDDDQDDGDDDATDPGKGDSCVGTDPHPVGERLAEEYEVPYEDIMNWFCAGHGFGEIKIALQAGEHLNMPAQDLLAMRDELGGWGQVWQELGFHGRPKEENKKGTTGDDDDATQPEQQGKQEKPDKPDKPDKPEKPEKPDKSNKPEKPEKPEKPDNSDKGNSGKKKD